MTRNITLSADPELIERARARARAQQTSLNAAFREWLASYAGELDAAQRYDAVMAGLSEVRPGRGFSRDEMNER